MSLAADILRTRILIVDDLESNVSLLEQMLRGAGYVSVASTQDPCEVCALHRKFNYDLILLDLHMPVMDGFAVMEGLKQIDPGGYLPVIVITAQPNTKLRALKAGAKDFITKPFELAEVLARVHNILEVRLLYRSELVVNLERLENSQRIAGLGDWSYDFTHQTTVWSDEVYRILGMSREASPPSADALTRLVHPEDLAFVQKEKKAYADGSRHRDFEHRIVRADGEVRHIHQITEVSFDEQCQPMREAGTIEDITERKLAEQTVRQSEERLQYMARAVSDVVWDRNLVDGTLWWNNGFLTVFGFAANEMGPGVNTWVARLHPEERAGVVEGIRQAIAGSTDTWSAEYRLQRKDGSYAVVQDRGHILRDGSGRGVRMVGGMRDLTDQKRMEAQLMRAQRVESIGTLAGGIAHDLNNVLAPIMMAIDLLKADSTDGERRQKILGTIGISCQRGADLVRQVLTFARGLDGQRIVMRLRHLIDDLVGIIGETFPRNITICHHLPNDLWDITGDPTQLHQVLLNLAVNARDAMPRGGTLTLTAANKKIDARPAGTNLAAHAGTYVVLEVADTGEGIPPEVRDRIFDPFFTTKAPGSGTGIGLATVHTVVKNHGGFITVDSEVGRGTTFKIYLPAEAAQRTGDLAPAEAEPPRGQGELILVADDEVSIRDITRQTLEGHGYRVLTAADGAEAVALFARQPDEIALVLVDMMMPIMDGMATIPALRRHNPEARIIAISGLAITEDTAKAAQASASDFLAKPYTTRTLLQLLADVIARPHPAPQ